MAKEPVSTSPEDAFVREVDEEFRREQLAGFWTRYGRWILIAVGLGLVALAAFLWWREEQVKARGAMSEQFTQAQQGLALGDPKAKAEIDRFASGDHGGYTVLARFLKATRAAEDGDTAGALAAYGAIASDSGLPQPMRDLATIKAIRLEYDTLAPAAAVERLRPLAQPGAPWFAVAGEMLALAYVRDGKPELAGPLFASIASAEDAAPSIRQRAQQMAATLGALPLPDTGTAAPAANAPPPPPAPSSPSNETEKN